MKLTKRTTIAITVICLLGLLSFPLHAESHDEWPMLYKNPQHTNYTECRLPSEMEVLWCYETGKNMIRSSPAVVNNKLYIVLRDYNLCCLDADTGKSVWKYKLEGEVNSVFWGELSSSPCVINGKVYVGSLDGNIYCIDAETGKKRWSYQTGDVVNSSPIVVDGKLYIGSGDHNLYCLDAETGKKIWSYQTDNAVYPSPSFYDNRVYLASRGCLLCIDASTGEELWRLRKEITGDPILIGAGRLYAVGVADGGIYCLNTETGKTIWRNADIKYPDSLALGNERIYLSIWMMDDGSSSIYCLDAGTGEVLWRYMERGDATFLSLVVADNRVYVRVTPSYLYSIDAETGEKIWGYKEDLLAWSTPMTIANGKIYAATANIYCIGPKKNTIYPYLILIILILVFFLIGFLLWKKRKTIKKLSLTHKLMILIGIFSLTPNSLFWFQGSISPIENIIIYTILYGGLIAIPSLAVLLFLVEEFRQSMVSLFFSFYIPFSVSFFIITIVPPEPIEYVAPLILYNSVFLPAVIYLLLVLLSSVPLLLSERGKNKMKITMSPCLFFLVLFLVISYGFNESPYDTAMLFIPFMVAVPVILYLTRDKVLQRKEEERKTKEGVIEEKREG
ncbi:MAG: PQQ-binding-like beta-propeller repeat protein [Euryarchaeota archaeon]|nr:PQQ-binding-like beta-propeller repeat protein [Euryarchaeota archaeon]